MSLTILLALVSTLVGALGLILAWVQLRSARRHLAVRHSAIYEYVADLLFVIYEYVADLLSAIIRGREEAPQVGASGPEPVPDEVWKRSSRRRATVSYDGLIAAVVGLVVVAVLITVYVTLYVSSPRRHQPTARVTVTATATPTPSGGQAASSGGGDSNYTALIAAIGAMIAGLGTAASGTAAVIALKRKPD